MSIERINILFISGTNCNWSSVVRSKQREGERLVKRNLTRKRLQCSVEHGVVEAFVPNACGQNGKGVRQAANAFPNSALVPSDRATLFRRVRVCSPPLLPPAYSSRAGRSPSGFARPALLAGP